MDRESWQAAAGMTGLATISARVLVLGRKNYPVVPSDVLSAVSPTDLAVAWGDAARDVARHAVELTQSDRRYNWRARTSDMEKPGVGNFTRLSGNWHMIPGNDRIGKDLERVKPDDIIQIEGDLVQVNFTDGTWYRSSLRRDDIGDGACEVILLRSIDVVGRAPLQ